MLLLFKLLSFKLGLSTCSVSNPFKTARECALWSWETHNKVNTRLMKEEESLGTGDPKYPKVIWPPKELCPSCYLGPKNNEIEWNDDEVFKFFISYYGRTLASLAKDKELIVEDNKAVAEDLVASTNAVAVPAGAAFAILVASCAFGGQPGSGAHGKKTKSKEEAGIELFITWQLQAWQFDEVRNQQIE